MLKGHVELTTITSLRQFCKAVHSESNVRIMFVVVVILDIGCIFDAVIN
jgi:hypothetical protein